jgi:hypothetical protein
MRFFSTLLPVVLATGALATPVLQRGTWSAPTDEVRGLVARGSANHSAFTPTPIFGCLLPWQATNIVNTFLYLLANPTATNFNATANALFSDDFTDTSDSINQLAGIPVRSCPFTIPSLCVLDIPRPLHPTDACGNYRKGQSLSQASQLSSLDPGHSLHFTFRPSIPSTAATRSAGAGSLSAVPVTTTRRLRVSTSSRSIIRARSRPPMQNSTAAPG